MLKKNVRKHFGIFEILLIKMRNIYEKRNEKNAYSLQSTSNYLKDTQKFIRINDKMPRMVEIGSNLRRVVNIVNCG